MLQNLHFIEGLALITIAQLLESDTTLAALVRAIKAAGFEAIELAADDQELPA